MTAQPTAHHLDVPGARLHDVVRGSGPLLLVIGQPMTSEPFAALADLLAEDRTVVTHDPHGLGRSTAHDPSLPVTPEVQADGLALAARHPERVRTLVAHEPPVAELLPDAAAQPDTEAPTPERAADDELFFLRTLKPFTRYRPGDHGGSMADPAAFAGAVRAVLAGAR